MKVLVLALALASFSATAQDKAPPAKKKQLAHKKPTPEQIRKFNDLQKKQAK
ncbi:MAG TPA: hypothetical protein VFK84_09265 [Burkholderiales bacterium]|nr:hypothetical protein [Burkholderiales bacterium]